MMYNPIINRMSRRAAAAAVIKISHNRGIEQALPSSVFCQMQWAYYLNNGLYDQLKLLGMYESDAARVKSIRNPAKAAVEFYAATIWPGSLHSLQLQDADPALKAAIRKIWQWSNWRVQKQVAVREAAITGDCFIRVGQPAGVEEPRATLHLIKAQYVQDLETDAQGYITHIRIDVPQVEADHPAADENGLYWHTEIWDVAAGQGLIYFHNDGPEATEEALTEKATAVEVVDLEAWGIDFVPVVQVSHQVIGEDFGIGAFTLSLDEIDELNILATRLHAMLFRHNKPLWALKANMMSKAGQPLPPPRIGNTLQGTEEDTVEMGGERMVKLPGMSDLGSLIPEVDYQALLDAIAAQLEFIQQNGLPELAWGGISTKEDLSGRALRILLSPATAKALEARGNHEDGLIRAHKMALTIAQVLQADGFSPSQIGTYAGGDFEHSFTPRQLLPYTREEIAEITQEEVGAQIPLVTSLRDSGKSEEWLAQMAEDQAAQQLAQQSTLAQAVLAAAEQSGGNNPAAATTQPDEL